MTCTAFLKPEMCAYTRTAMADNKHIAGAAPPSTHDNGPEYALEDFEDPRVRFAVPSREEDQSRTAAATGAAAAAIAVHLHFFGGLRPGLPPAMADAFAQYHTQARAMGAVTAPCAECLLDMTDEVEALFVTHLGLCPNGLAHVRIVAASVLRCTSLNSILEVHARVRGALGAVVATTMARVENYVAGDDPVCRQSFRLYHRQVTQAYRDLTAAAAGARLVDVA